MGAMGWGEDASTCEWAADREGGAAWGGGVEEGVC